MKTTLYALVAAFTAMVSTTGIVALATTAPAHKAQSALQKSEAELVTHLDKVIQGRISAIKTDMLALAQR